MPDAEKLNGNLVTTRATVSLIPTFSIVIGHLQSSPGVSLATEVDIITVIFRMLLTSWNTVRHINACWLIERNVSCARSMRFIGGLGIGCLVAGFSDDTLSAW